MVHVHTCYTSHARQPRPTTTVLRCTNNSGSRRAHHVDVDLLRQDLIDHYPKVKGTLPLF
ncbi:hypothetical protein BS47DRAFT_1348319, partial [Hydnum rufescens UP504]